MKAPETPALRPPENQPPALATVLDLLNPRQDQNLTGRVVPARKGRAASKSTLQVNQSGCSLVLVLRHPEVVAARMLLPLLSLPPDLWFRPGEDPSRADAAGPVGSLDAPKRKIIARRRPDSSYIPVSRRVTGPRRDARHGLEQLPPEAPKEKEQQNSRYPSPQHDAPAANAYRRKVPLAERPAEKPLNGARPPSERGPGSREKSVDRPLPIVKSAGLAKVRISFARPAEGPRPDHQPPADSGRGRNKARAVIDTDSDSDEGGPLLTSQRMDRDAVVAPARLVPGKKRGMNDLHLPNKTPKLSAKETNGTGPGSKEVMHIEGKVRRRGRPPKVNPSKLPSTPAAAKEPSAVTPRKKAPEDELFRPGKFSGEGVPIRAGEARAAVDGWSCLLQVRSSGPSSAAIHGGQGRYKSRGSRSTCSPDERYARNLHAPPCEAIVLGF